MDAGPRELFITGKVVAKEKQRVRCYQKTNKQTSEQPTLYMAACLFILCGNVCSELFVARYTFTAENTGITAVIVLYYKKFF